MLKTNTFVFVVAYSIYSEYSCLISASESFRGVIPFSTKYPELIIPDERVCLPRISCKKKERQFQTVTRNTNLQPFTDYLVSTGLEEEGLSGPVELPPGADGPDVYDEVQEDDINSLYPQEANLAELDNYLIDQSENECRQDQADYCDTKKVSAYKGSQHTMCKFCGIGPKCPIHQDSANNDLTGRLIVSNQIKELIVQLHNEVRSKIARGACEQPKAGCMGPVVWDDELARVAQKWADQCADVDYKEDYKRKDPSLFHDPHPQRKIEQFSDWVGVGQNVARDIAPGAMGEFNVTKLVGHWFRQIRFWDPKGVEQFGSGEQCSKGVGYYTQMVWENTTHVGCGWTQFQYRGFAGYFENFLVCNYGPSANIWGDPVYTIAETTCDCPCVDCDQKEGMCPQPKRLGSWGKWSRWGTCSATCGGGIRQRLRECTAPDGEGGREPCGLCKGEREERESCNDWKCPFWSEWAPWSQCSSTCGQGERTRQRTCDGTNFRVTYDESAPPDLPCPGAGTERESCDAGPCPAWTPWTSWSQCSQSCGGGSRTRIRECRKGRNYGDCVGEDEETEACNDDKCPAWTEWAEWTQCTKSCGGGKRTKVRKCVLLRSGEPQCDGESEVTEDCNNQDCPTWSPWSDWTQCSASCGGGQKSRQRDCLLNYGKAGSNNFGCVGESDETMECNETPCPVWTPWSDWTECSATCGGGVQLRARECVLPRERASGCVGDVEETRECNTNTCPVWTKWTNWTECSATCGGGTRFKVRECVIPDVRNVVQCDGDDKITETCNENPCPFVTDWSEWSECSRTCGGGTRTKTRECIYPATNERDSFIDSYNDCFETLEMSESCNENVCPVWTPWTDWTECTKTCGGGIRKKVRECVLPKGIDGCIGDSEVEEVCNAQECPVWTPWTEWTECTKTCDGGRQRRDRKCVLPERSGLFCPGEDGEERDCNLNKCPVWSPWTEWTPCTKTCGGGQRTSLRECVIPKSGDTSLCVGEAVRNEECNQERCPAWTEWGPWTTCTATCGGGDTTRVRECILNESGDADGECVGEDQETDTCNDVTCPDWTPWTEWTECTATCGGGSKKRSRDCVALRNGGSYSDCEGDSEEVEECNTEGCPDFSSWSEWSSCSQSCGGGMRSRDRHCEADGEEVCTCQCYGPIEEFETCATSQCPEWSPWSSWSGCSVTCGEGTQTRDRQCSGDGECPGEDMEVKQCKDRTCPTWTEWGDWSQCSASCGQGTRDRVRTCGPGARYLEDTCPGDDTEFDTCDAGTCYGWSQWQPWSSCSVTCGTGRRNRQRTCGALTRDTCEGEDSEEDDCEAGPCMNWSPWSSWSQCSATCGAGVSQRQRTCTPDGATCDGKDSEQKTCQSTNGPCPMWTPWSQWSSCSTTCGPGRQTRERQCEKKQPEIDIILPDNDLNLPDPENPIKDIDLPDGQVITRPDVTRLGLITGSTCPGAGQDSRECDQKPCTTTSSECDGQSVPSGFFSFNGRPATNVADCTWDYFTCTNKYGTWPSNKRCCDMRFKQCCVYIMDPTTTTRRPFSGYGPPEDEEIDIELPDNDLNLPDPENPIDDIDLADGQVVNRPAVAAVEAEPDVGRDLVRLCSDASERGSDVAPHPRHCDKFISCQRGTRSGTWLATVRDCSPGTVYDQTINQCNFRDRVAGCQTGRSRRPKVMREFFTDEPSHPVLKDDDSEKFIQVFEEVNEIFARQTNGRLDVSYNQDPVAQFLVSSSPSPSNNNFGAIFIIMIQAIAATAISLRAIFL